MTLILRAAAAAMLAILLTACGKSYVIDTARVATGLTLLDAQIDQTAAVIADSATLFTPAELDRLARAHRDIERLRAAARELVSGSGGVAQALIRADEVRWLYRSARRAYLSAREVVCPEVPADVPLSAVPCERLDAMPQTSRMIVVRLDDSARDVRDALERMLSAPDGADVTQTVSDLLTIGATAARIARMGAI